jgi:hypothetical protein
VSDWEGPYPGLSELGYQVLTVALALPELPAGPVTLAQLEAIALPLPLGTFDWIQQGGLAGVGSAGVQFGKVQFDLSGLEEPVTIAAVALVGGEGLDQLQAIVTLSPALDCPVGNNLAVIEVTLYATASLEGD